MLNVCFRQIRHHQFTNFSFHLIIRVSSECKESSVVSDSPGLVDFAIRLVNSVINLPNGQVKFFDKFKFNIACVAGGIVWVPD